MNPFRFPFSGPPLPQHPASGRNDALSSSRGNTQQFHFPMEQGEGFEFAVRPAGIAAAGSTPAPFPSIPTSLPARELSSRWNGSPSASARFGSSGLSAKTPLRRPYDDSDDSDSNGSETIGASIADGGVSHRSSPVDLESKEFSIGSCRPRHERYHTPVASSRSRDTVLSTSERQHYNSIGGHSVAEQLGNPSSASPQWSGDHSPLPAAGFPAHEEASHSSSPSQRGREVPASPLEEAAAIATSLAIPNAPGLKSPVVPALPTLKPGMKPLALVRRGFPLTDIVQQLQQSYSIKWAPIAPDVLINPYKRKSDCTSLSIAFHVRLAVIFLSITFLLTASPTR